MDLGLEGKTGIVSGSSRGIGRAIALGLLEEGAFVCVTGRDRASLEKTAGEFSGVFGNRVLSFCADLTETANIRKCMDFVLKARGRLDMAVANIGSGKTKAGWDADDEYWVESMEINFHSAVRFIRESARVMLPAKYGSIVAVSSIAGVESIPAPMAYSAAKSALLSYVKNAAGALGPEGIRINSVSPGNIFFEGGTWERITREKADWAKKYIDESVPMKRLGSPEEIASFVCFLLSERASFATGANIIIDGGQVKGIT